MFKFKCRIKPIRFLRFGLSSVGARNFSGHKTLISRVGLRVRWVYTYVNRVRLHKGLYMVVRFDFDSFRNCYLALVYDFKFGFSYYPRIDGLRILDIVGDNNRNKFGPGSSVPISWLSPGQLISNLGFSGSNIAYARSPGVRSSIVSFIGSRSLCKLSSGSVKLFSSSAICVIGPNGFSDYFGKSHNCAKAGFWVNRGRGPSVRGVAKNPVDHPHGGGEGRKSPPTPHRSPWGWVSLMVGC